MIIEEHENPIELFHEWLHEARQSDVIAEPFATTLATVGPDGMPSARVVLLKEYTDQGFTFFTNLSSQKGRELDAHPKAALCFHWMPLDKQVRIQGTVTHVNDEEADAYFATRPRESQINAWASRQSDTLAERKDLEQAVADIAQRFDGQEVPRPPFWSGYRIAPTHIEFWLRQPFRLHHRLLYTKTNDGWTTSLLNP